MTTPTPPVPAPPPPRRPGPDPATLDWTLLLLALLSVALMLTSFLGGMYSDDVLRDRFYQSVWYRALVAGFCLLTVLCLLRPRRVTAGFLFTHLAPVLLCLAAFLASQQEVRAFLTLRQGESGAELQTREGTSAGKLPFTVKLNRFHVEYYPAAPRLLLVEGQRILASAKSGTGETLVSAGLRVTVEGEAPPPPPSRVGPPRLSYHYPVSGSSTVVLGYPGDPLALHPASPGATFAAEPLGAEVTVVETLLDFVIEGGRAKNRSDRPENPAVRVRLRDLATGKTMETWLFARSSDLLLPKAEGDAHPLLKVRVEADGPPLSTTLARDRPYPVGAGAKGAPQRYLVWDHAPGMVKDYYSDLSILRDGKELLRRTAEVNHPLAFEGWLFFQTSYDDEAHAYTVLEALRDPWLPLFYAGAFLSVVGTALFCFAPRKGGE